MQTTVKASKAAKGRLDRLRHQVARQAGRRVSQRELVDHLIAEAARDPASVAAGLAGGERSMGPKEFEAFLRKRAPWGIADGSEDIDAWLYGGRG